MSDRPEQHANVSPTERRALLAELLRKKSGEQRAFPLSFAQQRLWFLDQWVPGNPAYTITTAVRLRGRLAPALLARSLNTIVQRHESLRTIFTMMQGQPVQLIQPSGVFPLELLDLRALPAHARTGAALRQALAAARQPFDLARGPLVRALVLRLSADEHVIVLLMHHIISDGWSSGVLIQELASLYTAFAAGRAAPLPALPTQYAAFAIWQRQWLRGAVLDQQLSYWRAQLAGLALLELPTDRPRPAVQRFEGAIHAFMLPALLTRALNSLRSQESATLYMVLLAAFQIMLYRYSGQTDIAVGSPIANRTRSEIEPLIGCFVNTLVLRADLSGNPTFHALARRVRELTQAAYAHQDLPFEKLVEELNPERNTSHTPLFQAMFVLQNAPIATQAVADLTLTPIIFDPGVAKFDLTLVITEQADGLSAVFEYATDLFDAPTIVRMQRHLHTLLAGIVAAPDQTIADLPLLTAAERTQILLAWNDSQASYPAICLHELVAAQARRTPDAVAVAFDGTNDERRKTKADDSDSSFVLRPSSPMQLTYAELDRRANQLAQHLRACGVGPETCVGVYLDRSLDLVISLLGVLLADGAYLPLDPTYPAERLALMLAEAQASVLITRKSIYDLRLTIDDLGESSTTIVNRQFKIVNLDADWSEISRQPATPPPSAASAANLAYVIYTSGSTGRPKGVMNTHGGIVNRLLWMQAAYGLTPSDRVLQKTPFSFDVSVWEFFWPLISGAALVLARPAGHKDSDYLARLIARSQITTLHFVPTMLQVFLDEPAISACGSLRWIICSGEALAFELRERCRARLGAALHNLYGPTEAAIDVTAWDCASAGDRPLIPIGRPIANSQIYLLDARMQPVPIGVAGELYIGGVQLARGYLHRPDLTAERFLPNPFVTTEDEGRTTNDGGPRSHFVLRPSSFVRLYRTGDLARYRADGAIEFLGRLDQQIKLRGFRIELGEIAAALRAHPAVQECTVTARADTPGVQIAAYIVPTNDEAQGTNDDERDPSFALRPSSFVQELRAFLAERLPDYMIPAAFVLLAALPLTPNGKLDRRALPAPTAARTDALPAYVAPRTPSEQTLAAIWAQVLGREVGVNDRFFALGGDSIRSIRMLALARERGLHFSLQQLFQHQSITELLQAMQAAPAEIAEVALVQSFSLIAESDRRRLPADVDDAYPLTHLQLGMLFHSELNPGAATYHDVLTLHLHAPFELTAWRAAVQTLLARHMALRTSFDLHSFDEPLQLVYSAVELPIHVGDLRDQPPAQQVSTLAAWFEAEKHRPFDWHRAPLLRLQIHRRSADSFQLTLSFHHAILDGWSLATMLTELSTLYFAQLGRAIAPLPPAPGVGYRDFVALERQAVESSAARADWQRRLRGYTMTRLPRWHPTEPAHGSPQIATQRVLLPAALTTDLQRLADTVRVPLKSVLLAAHLRVLQILSGQSDILTGLVANGRPEHIDGDRVLGLFLNTLPLRLELAGGSWRELVQAAFAAERELQPFRRYPLARLQQDLGGQPLFEAAFNFNHFHVYQGLHHLTDLQQLEGEFFEETNFTLMANVHMSLNGQLELGLSYDTLELCAEQIERAGSYYVRLLTAMCDDPHARYEQFVPLAAQERQQLLGAHGPDRAVEVTHYPHSWVGIWATCTPDAVALVGEGAQLTYRELNARSNVLAQQLRALNVGPEVLVGLCMARSLGLVIGLLGILKAGGAYVPLDPDYPTERLAFILADTQAAIVVTTQQLAARLPAYAGAIICLDSAASASVSPTAPPAIATPDQLAYLIYTSGSTGQPKGVMVQHGNIARLFAATQDQFAFGRDDTWTLFHSYAFDFSVWELWGALAYGGRLVIVPFAVSRAADACYRLLDRERVTVLNQTPSAFRQLIQADAEAAAPRTLALRLVIFGGEALDLASLQPWFARHGDQRPQLVNMYGITETTVHVTYRPLSVADLRQASWSVIGAPIRDLAVYVLDRHRQPVPSGTPGEVFVGGAGVARGYFNRPALTAERFVPNPFGDCRLQIADCRLDQSTIDYRLSAIGYRLYRTGDLARYLPNGELEYLGRVDQQVKVRGFRIEPGEIAATLRQHPQVQMAAVIARADGANDKRLVAYVVPRGDAGRTTNDESAPSSFVSDLRAFLQTRLPEYMLPAAFVVLDALPLTPQGKLDHSALPAADQHAPERAASYIAPQTATELLVARIWAEVLELERVGVRDHFFEIGGHSLLTMQVVSRIRAACQVDLPLRVLFDAPTIAELAEHIDMVRWAADGARPHTSAPAQGREQGEL
jgi:amino acid adenylation domain-containing protein